MPHRLLFASTHSYLDPSSGAALATRELLELLAGRGWDCRALTCGVLDYQNETPLEDVLAAIERPAPRRRRGAQPWRRGRGLRPRSSTACGSRCCRRAHSRAERAPNPREAAMYLDLAEQVLERFRPEILLTYGGHPVSRTLMLRARAKGTEVVFHLHNFGYNDRRAFEDVDAMIFPSEYSRRLYCARVGMDGVVISDPIRLDKVIAENREPKYVTFINPQPEKGAAVFARIALELGRRRPDIPLLVVEGRGTADGLAGLPVDLSGLTNLTPDGQHARSA